MQKITTAYKIDFLLRFGLGLIFLANSLIAWFSPNEFKEILSSSFLHSMFTNTDSLIYLIGINDGLLFLFFLFGKYRQLAAIWAGSWLIVVIVVTGITTPDFIEHLGILVLIAYYYFLESSRKI